MWRLKRCPRCKGDVVIDRDHNSWYEWCLQCGYQNDFNVSNEAKDRVAEKHKNTPDGGARREGNSPSFCSVETLEAEAGRVHNPKVAGSNPAPATKGDTG